MDPFYQQHLGEEMGTPCPHRSTAQSCHQPSAPILPQALANNHLNNSPVIQVAWEVGKMWVGSLWGSGHSAQSPPTLLKSNTLEEGPVPEAHHGPRKQKFPPAWELPSRSPGARCRCRTGLELNAVSAPAQVNSTLYTDGLQTAEHLISFSPLTALLFKCFTLGK